MVPPMFLAAAVAGVVSHVCYFNRGEHQMYGAIYVQLLAATYVTAGTILYQQGEPLSEALARVTSIVFCYLSGLYASLLIYRSLLHPLNKFPGPFEARLSKLWLTTQLKNEAPFQKVRKLHEQYGDFVRVGPSDLSIIHPKAVTAIYGQGSKCTKGELYDLALPRISLQTNRIKALHDQRRRVWSPAFSDKALRGYEDRMKPYRSKLISQFEAFDGQPLDVNKWFSLYTFDIMGDLAFGSSFNMLETSEEHWAIKLLHEGLAPLYWLLPVWIFRLMMAIPGLMRDYFKLIGYCNQRLDERMSSKEIVPDIMTTLLAPLKGSKPSHEELEKLRGDSQLIVVAGSDTTSTVLTTTMLELARHPEQTQKLRDELVPYMPDPSAEISHQEIANLEHLNAVIYETMRLYPPVPTAMDRKTPPEGIEIGGQYIPGNMTVWCPQYAIGRKEEIYTQANAFIPERWYMYPEMIKEKSAWAPFSTGPYGCIGRPLAMVNLRTTLAQLVMRFDISFPPSDSDKGITFEAKTTEHFTLHPAELKLCFQRRRIPTA